MKTDLPFFSHDNNARNHPKMKALRAQFGPSGYGQFWMLNEMIAEAEEARLDLTKRVNKGAAAGELGMDYDQFDAFLAFLSDPEIDLINYSEGIVTTDRTTEDYARVKVEREAAQARKSRKKESSPEKDESSGELPKSSGELYKRAEQSRAEENKSSSCAREELSPELRKAFHGWAVHEARKVPGIRKPERYAEKIEADPERLKEFLASLPQPDIPDPGPCTREGCGGAIVANKRVKAGKCSSCGAIYEYDDWTGWMRADGT